MVYDNKVQRITVLEKKMFYFFHTLIEKPKIYTLSLRNYSYIGLLQRNKDNVYDI